MKNSIKLSFVVFIIIFVLPFISNSKGLGKKSETTIHDALNNIRWNQVVKVETENLKEVSGRKNKVANDTLYLESDDNMISLPLSKINTLWVQENRAKRGMVTGAVIGGTIGFGIGMYFRDFSIMGPSETHNERPVIGALLGAGVGAMIFGSIGSISKHWEEKYSSDNKYNFSFSVIPDVSGGVYMKVSLDL